LPLLDFNTTLQYLAILKSNKGKGNGNGEQLITNFYVKWRTAKDLVFFFFCSASLVTVWSIKILEVI
jgi:hypothetical protein